MIKKPIKKLSYFNDLWVCIEYREYILKKEYDYPILDRMCPEYIPKDIEDFGVNEKYVDITYTDDQLKWIKEIQMEL